LPLVDGRSGDRSRRRARARRRRRIAAAAAVAVVAAGVALGALALTGHETTARTRPTNRAAPVPSARARPPGYRGAKLAATTPRPSPRNALPTPAEQAAAVKRLLKLGYPVLCGGGKGNAIAMTFDDGPGPYTPTMRNILERRGLRATFFLVGRVVELWPLEPRREAKLGALGDHSWSHPYLPGLPDVAIDDELRRALELIKEKSKAPVLLFRPPYGGRDGRVDRIARDLGLLQVIWSVDSGDAAGADVEGVYRNILAGLKPGAIILMHENRATTIKSLLRYVLPEIKRRKLRTVSVPELLALDPPSLEQLRNRDC
jgi:peptidoglycan/xylan/chitin deacetylase (PgdA/CDA1 family)